MIRRRATLHVPQQSENPNANITARDRRLPFREGLAPPTPARNACSAHAHVDSRRSDAARPLAQRLLNTKPTAPCRVGEGRNRKFERGGGPPHAHWARVESGSPATGSKAVHDQELGELMEQTLAGL